MSAEEALSNNRHDNILRGCYYLPQALAYLTADPALAQELQHLQATLLPEQLQSIIKSYREEAGQGALLKSRLTPEQIALLKRIKTLDGTLWDAVNEWIKLAAKLGELEDERITLNQGTGPAPADVLNARNKWIRTVNALRTVLDLVEADHEGVKKILKRITATEERAERRALGGTEDDSATPETPVNEEKKPEEKTGGAEQTDPA